MWYLSSILTRFKLAGNNNAFSSKKNGDKLLPDFYVIELF